MKAWEPMLRELENTRRGRLLGFATMLAGADFAEDLVQDAVIATFSRHRGFASVEQAESYVRRAIASRFVDVSRKTASRRRWELAAAPAESQADPTESVATSHTVLAALNSLPPRERACVALRFLEDLSIHDTAAALKLSEGAVKRYVSDGLKTLNAALGTDARTTDEPGHLVVQTRRNG